MNKLAVSILFLILGLAFMLIPDKVITPTPVNNELTEKIKTTIGSRDKEQLLQLGASLRAASNLFKLDSQRSDPYYKDPEDIKWATRRTNELSYPAGFVLESAYPGLASLLGDYIDKGVGDNPNQEKAADILGKVADSIDGVK